MTASETQQASSAETAGSSCAAPTGPAAFPHFSLLPPELRRLVWMECLPRRIVPVLQSLKNPPRSRADDGEFLWGHMIMESRARPPLIAQVCRESREVALEFGRLHQVEPLSEDSPPKVWYDCRTDIPLLAATPAMFNDTVRLEDMLSRARVAVCIDRKCAYDVTDDECIARFIIESTKITRVWVIIRAFVVQCTRQAAAASGLFESLDDDPSALIDAHDGERLLALFSLDLLHQAMPSVEWRFPGATSPPGQVANTGELALDVRQSLEDVYLDLVRDAQAPRDEDGVIDPTIYPADAHLKAERYDRDHAWVQEALRRLPALEMKVAAHFCDAERCRDAAHVLQRDLARLRQPA